MKELADIVNAYRDRPGDDFVLATVVEVTGSSYRRPGARMLICPDGETIGSISGGCLEQDVIAHASGVLKTGQTILLTYDTTSEEDIIFGLGLGCQGVISILLECVTAKLSQNFKPTLLDFIENIFQRGETGIVATIIRREGLIAEVGERLMLDQHGDRHGTFSDGLLETELRAEMAGAWRSGKDKLVKYAGAGGSAEIVMEVIASPTPLIIFGAGHDAIPMVRLAKEIGFHVTVVDHRPAYATTERFPQADQVIVSNPGETNAKLMLTDRTVAVVMSHNYLSDQDWLKFLLPNRLRYVGLMGPKKRAEKMIGELFDSDCGFTPQPLRNFYNPVGLDIGAENPGQIALAILAEIQAVISGHAGGSLREKQGAIHSSREPLAFAETFFESEPILCLASGS